MSTVPDQLWMAILSIIPRNPLYFGLFSTKSQFGYYQNVCYLHKSVISESVLPKNSVYNFLSSLEAFNQTPPMKDFWLSFPDVLTLAMTMCIHI